MVTSQPPFTFWLREYYQTLNLFLWVMKSSQFIKGRDNSFLLKAGTLNLEEKQNKTQEPENGIKN